MARWILGIPNKHASPVFLLFLVATLFSCHNESAVRLTVTGEDGIVPGEVDRLRITYVYFGADERHDWERMFYDVETLPQSVVVHRGSVYNQGLRCWVDGFKGERWRIALYVDATFPGSGIKDVAVDMRLSCMDRCLSPTLYCQDGDCIPNMSSEFPPADAAEEPDVPVDADVPVEADADDVPVEEAADVDMDEIEGEPCIPATEICNGRDDDCDGLVDEDYVPYTCGTGACESQSTCTAGSESCSPRPPRSTEDLTCDGIDDDCDGVVDEDYVPYSCGVGFCRNASICDNGSESCTPADPLSTSDVICDGIDDDCDGFVDEDYVPYSCGVGFCRNASICDNGSESCTPAPPLATQDLICDGVDEDCDGNTDEDYVPYSCGRGACLAQSTCVAGFEDCTPGSPPAVSDSVCDGIDEDCDGNVDEDYIPYICGLGDCQRNSQCVGSVQSCTPGPQTGNDQNCDGHDNDCDGSTDEGYTPYTCGTGPCSAQSTCIAGVENCTPGSGTPEVCNGIDDDCDGNCDEGWTCCAGTSVGCATSCGTTGTETCSSTCTSGPCTPPAETCNGMDDDCNGICDEPGCCRGATESCTTSCGSTGTHTCDSTCQWGSCIPPTEICNGVDDDCDGSTDEDYVPWICGMGACIRQSTCTGGVENCTPGTPETEICFNGADDDCDGFEDEDCTIPCPSPQVCPGATDALSPNPVGNRFLDATSDAFNYSGSCGGSQAPDAVYSFTVASLADAFITTHGSFFDTVLYVRACTCDGTELACSDDADGLTTSAIHLRNLPAGTYNIFVDGKTSLSYGNFQMDVYVTAAGLEGDRCGDPVLLTSAGYTYSDPNSTCLMSSDYEPATSGSGAGDCGRYVGTGKAEEMVFYMWVPSDGTVVTLSTCSSASLPSFNTDTALYVRTVCIDGGESCQLGCSDDNRCASGTSDDHLSHLPLTLDRGLYYVISDGYYQADPLIHTCGEFSLSVTGLP